MKTFFLRLSVIFVLTISAQVGQSGMAPLDVFDCEAYKVELPKCTPAERLARWNGTTWVTVNPGELSSGNIHVLVHGWAPGLKTFATDGGKIWDANDPKTGANTNQDGYDKFTNLAKAIVSKSPGDIVVEFNWVDLSATNTDSWDEAHNSRAQTDLDATYLEDALKSSGISAGNFSGKIQIVGFSHGARVATLATKNLYNQGKSGSSIVVDQLTLADSPEGVTAIPGLILKGANNGLNSILQGVNIGRTSGTTFVDNYYSYFGGPYAYNKDVVSSTSIVNVRLNPPFPISDFRDNHAYSVSWYTGSTNSTSTLGFAWSPIVGNEYMTLSSYYEQNWASGEYSLKDTTIVTGVSNSSLPVQMSTLLTTGSVTDIPNGKNLTEHSPAYWHSDFMKNEDDTALEFTYQFVNPGDGDQLSLWIDDQMRFVITGNLAGTDAFTTNIDIGDLFAGSHILSVALNNYGEANASVNVTDITMVSTVPEPSILALLFAGAIFFAGVSKLRSK
ncbi:MAG: PEP-CTERM sorting domain-containing protein [Candidatus Staskawiczbacteria bacterium]|nr:PEP-CTERM sorting domain-containing protein [Candidatus Staskawiczbacteria bacterium]